MNIEVGQIELQGSKYYCELNMVALEEFLEREGKDLTDFGDYLGAGKAISKMVKLIHFMLEYGHRVMGKPFDATVEQVAVLVGFNVEHIAAYIMAKVPTEAKEATKKQKGRQTKAKQ